jgi:hypothetical protein
MITSNEFHVIAKWSKKETWRFVKKMTVQKGHRDAVTFLLSFRRDLQEALSKYSKGMSGIDDLQMNVISITMWIEKWCHEWYVPWKTMEMIKENPDLAVRAQKVKGLVNSSWELELRRRSY